MKLGIMADTHNNLENTWRALNMFREQGVMRVIHCGDLSTSAIVELFAGFQATFVFGNIDQGHADMMEKAKQLIGPGAMGYTYTGNIGGALIAVCHGDDQEMLHRFIQSGTYDYVFYGHTHEHSDRLEGKTRVINPGALGGRQVEPRSVCILDLETGATTFLELDEEARSSIHGGRQAEPSSQDSP